MSHKGTRLLIEDVSKSLGDNIKFTYARTEDFNVMRDKVYPFITLEPLNATASFTVNNVSNYMKVFNATLTFYQLDKESSIGDDYKKILDDMDHLVDQFITKLNFFSNNDEIIIQNINQQPFIKATADILTGWILTFQIVTPDNWNYCVNAC